MTRYLLFFNRLLLAHNSSMKSQWLNSATHNYSICISEPFTMCAQAQCSFGLKGPLLTRPHCTYSLYTRNSKMFSGDCFTERIFQIYFLFKEIEEIESPVIILPGGKCDCQQRHALPLPRVAYASNLPSPPPIPEPRDRVRLTWQAPQLLFIYFFCCVVHLRWWRCVFRIEKFTKVVCHGERYSQDCVLPHGVCACYLGSLAGCDASMRGRAHGIWFDISAVFAAYSALIHGRRHHQRVKYALLLSQ